MTYLIRYCSLFVLMICNTYLWRACADKRIVYDLSFSRDIIKLELVTFAITIAIIILFVVLIRDVIKYFAKS